MSDIFNLKKGWVQNSIETKVALQMGFMGIIIATSPKRFTGENTFYYYL